jgi:hypothetical protein
VKVSSHSTRKNAPLTAKAAGTIRRGAIRRLALAFAATSAIEQAEVATSISGSDVKSNDARNRASRVALPLTNCAVTAPEQNIAVISHRDFTSATPPFRASP